MKNDTNKEKEYLISLSSWRTVLELYDLDEDEYKIMASTVFTNKDDGIFSFVFQILEAIINNQNIYFCIYIYSEEKSGRSFGNNIVIKKIALDFFDFHSLEIIKEIEEENYNNRITSGIIVDKYELLIIFSVREIMWINYYLKCYNYDLEPKGEKTLDYIYSYLAGYGHYFKSYYLYDDYIGFFAFTNQNGEYIFRILKIIEDTQNNFDFQNRLFFRNNTYYLNFNIKFNDFVKFDEERLALITTKSRIEYQNELFIILFDLYRSYTEMKVRNYYFTFTNDKISQFSNELSAFVYNGYLMLTGIVSSTNNPDNTFPILLIFGYVNGTDSEINLLPYLSDCDAYDSSKNLVNDLVENIIIDNNIFNYQKEAKIKLVSIPPEILFYNSINNLLVSNGGILGTNYILRQNRHIIKEDKYYFLEYQNIITEADYDLFYGNAFDLANVDTSSSLIYYFEPRKLYGRINTLRFKLCNLHCRTCIKFGVTEINQECESCLDGYKYFINDVDNTKTCININSPCPENFPFYNDLTKECMPPPKSEVPTTFQKDNSFVIKSSLIPDINPINIKNSYSSVNNIKEAIDTSDKTYTGDKTDKIDTSNKADKAETNNMNDKIDITNMIDKSGIINTIDKSYSTDINANTCSYQELILTSCSRLNYNNEQLNNEINNGLIPNDYDNDKGMIIIKGQNNSSYGITTTELEIKRLLNYDYNPDGLSIVILGNCENLLKIEYGIDKNLALIIKKYEQIALPAERNVQFEVYDPIKKKKLNLSICDKEQINIYVPTKLTDDLLKLYNDLKKYGYDLFNINDPFYNDICTPYTSINYTDVILVDRKNDFYNNNYTTCQSFCHYSSLYSKNTLLNCECKVIAEDIDVNNTHKFNQEIVKYFYEILENTNLKVMQCYKLVFNWNYLKKNIGSFIVLALFCIYLIFFIIYLIHGIKPLKDEANKKINKKINNILKDHNLQTNFPPKKTSILIANDSKIIKIQKRKSRKKSSKRSLNKIDITCKNKDLTKSRNKLNLFEDSKTKSRLHFKSKLKVENTTNNKDGINKNKLDDLYLNNLAYDKAFELDKRKFTQIYWSYLKNKHLIIFTFIVCLIII